MNNAVNEYSIPCIVKDALPLTENENIYSKLGLFIHQNKVPHIIFHGGNGCGKKTILYSFLFRIYNDDVKKIRKNVLYVNCAHGKGIKFIREDIKFFAKTNVQVNENILFKSIVLFNAEYLTTDAQSALRRSIEQFSHTTRFFIVTVNKNKLLQPILSRFCEIYIPNPIMNDKEMNLHVYHIEKTMPKAFLELGRVRKQLEKHFDEMQDIEFTIQNNKLWMLQTRTGKRTGIAAVKIATDIV